MNSYNLFIVSATLLGGTRIDDPASTNSMFLCEMISATKLKLTAFYLGQRSTEQHVYLRCAQPNDGIESGSARRNGTGVVSAIGTSSTAACSPSSIELQTVGVIARLAPLSGTAWAAGAPERVSVSRARAGRAGVVRCAGETIDVHRAAGATAPDGISAAAPLTSATPVASSIPTGSAVVGGVVVHVARVVGGAWASGAGQAARVGQHALLAILLASFSTAATIWVLGARRACGADRVQAGQPRLRAATSARTPRACDGWEALALASITQSSPSTWPALAVRCSCSLTLWIASASVDWCESISALACWRRHRARASRAPRLPVSRHVHRS